MALTQLPMTTKPAELKVLPTVSVSPVRDVGLGLLEFEEVASIPNVLSIPLEAVTNDRGYSYVYKRDGRGVGVVSATG